MPEDVCDRVRGSAAGRVLFSELAPRVSSSRQQAAATFTHLLQLHATRVVLLSQTEPYGEIHILPPRV